MMCQDRCTAKGNFQNVTKISAVGKMWIKNVIQKTGKTSLENIKMSCLLVLLINELWIMIFISVKLLNVQIYNIFLFICEYLLFAISMTAFTQFIVLMNSISHRFELMNSCIENSVNELPKIHLKIIEYVKIYNSIFGLQNFFQCESLKCFSV